MNVLCLLGNEDETSADDGNGDGEERELEHGYTQRTERFDFAISMAFLLFCA